MRRRGSQEKVVAARLRHFRTTAGITQDALARAAKLTPKFVSQIENGHVNPSIAALARLVEDGLGIPLAAFFATDAKGDTRDELAKLVALFANQPPMVRRRALRVMKALCADDSHDDALE
jgi:transcriptional regulator with XRE-family HTH domain